MPEDTEITKRSTGASKKKSKVQGKNEDGGSPSKNTRSKSKDKIKAKTEDNEEGTETQVTTPPKFGRMTSFTGQRLWSRSALILGLMVVIYFTSKSKEQTFAKYDEVIPGKAFETKCSPELETELKPFPSCRAGKCGRILSDNLILPEEAYGLREIAERGLVHSGGLSAIYDLTTGKLLSDKETNLLKKNSSSNIIFKKEDGQYFQVVQQKLRRMISEHFRIDYWTMDLITAYFMKLTPKGDKIPHITRLTVHLEVLKSHYTGILFLSNHGVQYSNSGRLVFPDSDMMNKTIEGKIGRALGFTSGYENLFYIEPIEKGSLIALVVGFTCDKKKANPKTILN